MASIELQDADTINVSMGEASTLQTGITTQDSVNVESTDGFYERAYTETDPIFSRSVASGITQTDITNWNSKSDFSGDYNDLGNKPELFSGDYDDLENKPTIPTKTSDLTNDSGFLTEHQDISGKVDKETGKGLSTNDFTTTYKSNVDSNTTARHTHSNKSVLDDINSNDVSNWNNKLDSSDLIDYVKNTDYATDNTGGVVKINSAYGLKLNSSGTLYTSNENYNTYSNANNNFTISKGTLENVITGKQLANQTDLSAKQDSLVSGTNIKTINNQSILGSGNITIQGGGGSGDGDMLKSVYDTNDNGIVDNAEKVNNHTVGTDVPSNAVFTDTVYDDTSIRQELNYKADSSDIPTKTSDLTNDSGFLTQHQDISGKVDKETGKGLSTNDFTTAYKNNVDSNTSARHTHSNKSVLDSISSTDITNWNNKSTFSGSYNDLTNKPTIPSKTSDLTNDSGYITGINSTDVTTALGYTPEHEMPVYNYEDILSINSTSDEVYIGIKNAIDGRKQFFVEYYDFMLGKEYVFTPIKCDFVGNAYRFYFIKTDDANSNDDVYTEIKLQNTSGTSVTVTEKSYVIADYITERGNNNNGWAWTKYKSGRIELTGWVQYTGITCTTQSQGTYYGGSKTTTMPFSLRSLYLMTTQETSTRSSGIYVYIATVSGATVTTDFRTHASTTNGSCGVFYHVIGYL